MNTKWCNQIAAFVLATALFLAAAVMTRAAIGVSTASDNLPTLGQPASSTYAQTIFDCDTVTDGIPVAECEALVSLYNATGGPNWTQKAGWLDTNAPCSWHGVDCQSGHVASLYLSSNNLSGAIPSDIGHLTALENFGVGQNQLTSLPPEIGNLTALQWLSLSNNQLTSLPPTIGNLEALRNLGASQNQLTSLPPEIGNLTALQWLFLSNNQLTSLPPTIGNLEALRNLGVENNLLTELPETIGALSSLTWLALSRNMLSGLPATIGDLTALEYLFLDGNQLSALPNTFGSLTALLQLHLHDNPLSGPMPDFMSNLTAMGQGGWYFGSPFTFFNTNWCVPDNGSVPAWLNSFEYEGTGFVCGQPTGGISGRVTLTDTTPVAGIQVYLYRAFAGDEFHPEFGQQWLVVTEMPSGADGRYQFGGLGQGIDYRVYFVDPAHQYAPQYYNNTVLKEFSQPVTVTLGLVRPDVDAILRPPQPPVSVIDPGGGSVTYNPDGTANIQQFRGNVTPITVTLPITCPGGIAPTDVTLSLMVWGWPSSEYPMNAVGDDLYQAVIPADDVETATLSVSYKCGEDVTETTVGYITLYDPSGIITNARSGEPVVGATVTLYHVPGWLPRTGPTDTRPNTCESHNSKAETDPWSQPAPTDEGVIANSEITPFAPKLSYQQTNEIGYYGWDVSEGCWYVRVEAEGYTTLISPVVGVPPEVTDLDLVLMPDMRVYLPLILR